jgi:uncharacterized protein YjbI with pentapeptide repeats
MKLRLPQIPAAADLEVISPARLGAEQAFERVRLQSGDASNLVAKGMNFDEALLEKVIFVSAALEKLSLDDAELRACDFSAAQCNDASWVRVRATSGRMSGIDLSRSVLKDVLFESCKLDMANFRFAKLTRVTFVDCVCDEADFQGAELHEVKFVSSHLEKTEFAQCKIKSVDARTSELIDIRGWQSLCGLKVDAVQLMTIAPQLAATMGIIVAEKK